LHASAVTQKSKKYYRSAHFLQIFTKDIPVLQRSVYLPGMENFHLPNKFKMGHIFAQ
jgi:hypothetical protein